MTPTWQAGVTHGHGALPRDLAASQRRPAGLVTRRAAHRAERAALDNPAGAATHQLVASATHHQRTDPSQKLDTGQQETISRSHPHGASVEDSACPSNQRPAAPTPPTLT
jgi:hypothetical protein